MAETIETLMVRVSADLSDLKKEMQKSRDVVKSGTQDMKKSVENLIPAWLKLAVAIRGARAVYRQFSQSVSRGDEVIKMARNLNIATADLQAMRYAGELAGVSTEKLNIGLLTMTRQLGLAARGTGEARDALKQLGMNAKDLIKLSPSEQFTKIADGIAKIENSTQAAAVASRIFGESGQRLITLLQGGAEAIRNAKTELDSFGTLIQKQDEKKIEHLKDATTRLDQAWAGFTNQLTIEYSPAAVKALNLIADAMKTMRGESLKSQNNIFGAVGGTRQSVSADRQAEILAQFYREQAVRGPDPLTSQAELDVKNAQKFVDNMKWVYGQFATIAKEKIEEVQKIHQENTDFNMKWILARQDVLKTGLTAEEEALDASFERRKELLAKYIADGILMETDRQELLTTLQAQYTEKRLEIERNMANKKRGIQLDEANFVISQFKTITSAIGEGSRQQFEVTKALGIAEATVNTARAIMQAWAKYAGTPGGAAQVALIAAAGAAQIAKISSTQFNGGGAGTADAGTSVSDPAPLPTQDVNVMISGNALMNAEGIRDLLASI
jgi:hypothetical protein